MHLGTVALCLVAFYYAVTRLLPQLLSCFLVWRYNLQISLGRIGLHPLCVYQPSLEWGPLRLTANWVNITSSLVNSQVHRPLAFCLHGVRLAYTGVAASPAAAAAAAPASAGRSSASALLSLGQFAGLYIYQAGAEWAVGGRRRARLQAARVTLEGTNTIDNGLMLVLRAAALCAQLDGAAQTSAGSGGAEIDGADGPPPLARLTADLELQATVQQGEEHEPRGPGPAAPRLKDVSIRLLRPDVLLSDRLVPPLLSALAEPPSGPPPSPVLTPGETQSKLDKWRKRAPRAPLSASLSFSELALTSVHGARRLATRLGSCRLEASCAPRLADAAASLKLEELSVEADDATRIASLASLQLSVRGAELESPDPSLEAAFGGHTLQLTYSHEAVSDWLTRLGVDPLRRRPPLPPPPPPPPPVGVMGDRSAARRWRLRLDAELWDVESCFLLPALPPVIACLTHGKLGGSPYTGELVLETLTCCLGTAVEPAPRRHVTGAALVLGALLVSHRRAADAAPAKLGLLLENLQLEASEQAAALAQFAVETARRLMPPPARSPVSATAAPATNASTDLTVQASNLTLLAVTDEHCSALRLDSVAGERTAGLLSVTVERAAVSAGRPLAAPPLPCHKGAALPEQALSVAKLKVRGRTDGELSVSVRETAAVQWSPTTHRHLKSAADCMKRWSAQLRPAAAVAAPPPLPSPSTPAASGLRLTVRLHAELTVDATLSDRCRLGLAVSDLTWTKDSDRACLTAAAPRVLFDRHEIVTLRGLKAERTPDHPTATAHRAACEDLVQPSNTCWEVTIASLEGSVPYGYDFAEAWSEELLTTIRWVKRLHGRPSGPAAEGARLPADICLQIKQLSMEICDDPFEVKLRDNYELLEDEYHESVKRRQTLDLKIEEQRRRHGLLQARKVESLYQQLQQRDAQLFVQRAGQMYQTSPMRTRLLLWTMESLEVWALADPSLHGRAACVGQMRRIDPLSPWPDEEPAFSTLWCRELVASCQRWTVTLRDYPQPLLDVTQLHLWGRLVGAEQTAVARATRRLPVRLKAPFEDELVERSLMSLKYYYDLSSDVEQFVAAYGPCWEPAVAMFNLCLEKVLKPSADPSPPLPWWDKTRLKMHGRLTQSVRQMTLLLHASLDPYNTTEEMELTFAELVMDWTDGKIVFKGDLSVYVRTASKYDDCRLLCVPGLKLAFKLDWLCMGDPRDHHAVVPCARDRLPEYSSNQEHDSFRAFRSQNLNLSISIETRPLPAAGGQQTFVPCMLLYGSTLRWFENLQFILSGMTRPTRRGAVFSNVRPRKVQLSRHYKCVRLSLNLHAFQVSYWMSFTRQHGLDVRGDRVSLSSEHRLTLRPVCDGLLHRPRACWAIEYLNCELNDAEVWLQSSLGAVPTEEATAASAPPPPVAAGPVEKWFFLSVARVSYGRAASVSDTTRDRDSATHRLVVHNMKAAWTKDNRDAGFALFDSFTSNQQLKRNLSTAALKGITFDSGSGGAARTPQKPPRAGSLDSGGSGAAAAAAAAGGLNSSLSAGTPSPMSRLQSGQAASMLQKLVAELGAAPVAFSEDATGGELDETALRGVAACHATDVLHNSWLIELVNCQVLLKGIETRGYVIITSSKSQVLQRLHRPVWRDRTLVSKTSWVGRLDGMQYYATVSAGSPASDPATENIMWLTVDNIEERDDDDIRDVPDLVGSGQSVGGVVTETVGAASADEHDSIQLQRVVSRCRCEFFYASYGEVSVDPDSVESIPPLPSAPSQLWPGQEEPVDALTVTHHDLNVCTNSLQYAMVLDIVNNLLLYVAPRRRQSSDQLQRMRFQMQLSALEDQRRPIQQLQNRCRAMMSEIRQLEKTTYQLQRQRDELEAAADRAGVARVQAEMTEKERQTLDKKEQLSASAEELAMRIHIYKETQLSKTPKPTTRKGDAQQPVSMIRTAEVCIRHAQWRLTEPDGQLGLADLVISNFQYTKHTKSDDSVEHLLELGYISMSNLLPNPAYRDVLQPTETQSGMPVDRQRSLRVYFRERPPVGGISVKEHLEINITPINIGMTYQFFKTMLRFCFPERDTENLEEDAPAPKEKLTKKEKRKQKKESSFYVAIEKDDVEKMKERAQNNMLFIYIKVPEVTVRVSYKGEKEKNLEDVHNFLLTVPTLEYHNVTWTWLDLLLAMTNDTRRVLLSQAIKQKLQIGGGRGGAQGTSEEPLQDEKDKARLLFGSMMAPGSEKEKPARKGFFHLHRS